MCRGCACLWPRVWSWGPATSSGSGAVGVAWSSLLMSSGFPPRPPSPPASVPQPTDVTALFLCQPPSYRPPGDMTGAGPLTGTSGIPGNMCPPHHTPTPAHTHTHRRHETWGTCHRHLDWPHSHRGEAALRRAWRRACWLTLPSLICRVSGSQQGKEGAPSQTPKAWWMVRGHLLGGFSAQKGNSPTLSLMRTGSGPWPEGSGPEGRA